MEVDDEHNSQKMMEVDDEHNFLEKIKIYANNDLLNSYFEKYILSNEQIPLLKKVFGEKVHVILPSNEQWSRHDLKLFNMVNPILLDLYHSSSTISTFILFNKSYNFIRSSFNYNTLSFAECQPITLDPPLPNAKKTSAKSLPVSFLFGSLNYIFISNGNGNLCVYKFDVEGKDEIWTMIRGYTLKEDSYELHEGCDTIGEPFIIADVRKVNDTRFELALINVVQLSEEKRKGGSMFANKIYWISFELKDACEVVHTRCYHVCGNLEFVTFSSAGDEIVIHAAKEPEFVFDSNPIKKPKHSNSGRTELEEKTEEDTKKATPAYYWSQSQDGIIITFNLDTSITKDDVRIQAQNLDSIAISVKDVMLLEGNLYAEIDDINWDFRKNIEFNILKLDVTLHKLRPKTWPHLVPTDYNGVKIITGAPLRSTDGVPRHDEVAHTSVNPNLFEEVDEDNDEINYLYWVSGKKQCVSRMADLSFHTLIFTQQFHSNKPLSLCFRGNVHDGIVYSLNITNESTLEHCLTLDAFGYIQAGKEAKRFLLCAPDGSYSVIVDTRNHAYFYLKRSAVSDTELRNTKTKKTIPTVARQHVVSLASMDPEYGNSSNNPNIIFAAAREKVMFMATDWAIYACPVN